MKCRHCGNSSFIPFADLGSAPPSNAMLTEAMLDKPEPTFPLVVEVCDVCFLAQIDEHKAAVEIFDADYTYFSSFSKSLKLEPSSTEPFRPVVPLACSRASESVVFPHPP